MLKLDTPDNRRQLEGMQQLDRQVHAFGEQLALLDGAFFASAAELMQHEPLLLQDAAAALDAAARLHEQGQAASGGSRSRSSTPRPQAGAFRRHLAPELARCGFVAVGGGRA
jgi:hypothetical protein